MRTYEITIRYIDTEDPSSNITDKSQISADSLESYPSPTDYTLVHWFPTQWRRFSSYKEFLANLKTQPDETS
jgi:hypothetical protein